MHPCTHVACPNQAIILELCRWGCSHEKQAIETYESEVSNHHTKFSIEAAGLFISMERPYVGASPDGIISCECCGRGTLEVKCPFCYKENFPEEDTAGFCMKKNTSGIRMHAYMHATL